MSRSGREATKEGLEAGRTSVFIRKDVGCWIDAAYGELHAVEKMKSMIAMIDPNHPLIKEGMELETDPEPDTYISDWLLEATELLQENTEGGLVWLWEAGDLILTTIEEAELF